MFVSKGGGDIPTEDSTAQHQHQAIGRVCGQAARKRDARGTTNASKAFTIAPRPLSFFALVPQSYPRPPHPPAQKNTALAPVIHLPPPPHLVACPSRRVDRLPLRDRQRQARRVHSTTFALPSICPCRADAREAHRPSLGNARPLRLLSSCVVAWATKPWGPARRSNNVLLACHRSPPLACLPTGPRPAPVEEEEEEETTRSAPPRGPTQASRPRPVVAVARKGGCAWWWVGWVGRGEERLGTGHTYPPDFWPSAQCSPF